MPDEHNREERGSKIAEYACALLLGTAQPVFCALSQRWLLEVYIRLLVTIACGYAGMHVVMLGQRGVVVMAAHAPSALAHQIRMHTMFSQQCLFGYRDAGR